MRFALVPILEHLRDLYRIPRGLARFQAYINITIAGAQKTSEVAIPPLMAANPMAKEHALEFVETWMALGAEAVAGQVLEEANVRLGHVPYPRTVQVGLTVLDDQKGGWTNHTFNDAGRFKTGETLEKTGWLGIGLWTSEPPKLEELRPRVLEGACRAAFVAQHGNPQTLRDMIRQEGLVAAFAGRTLAFDAEELEYSRAVIAPHLESTHQPTLIACLYGDEAAKEVGYPPLGLSRNAGFQVGLADALVQGRV